MNCEQCGRDKSGGVSAMVWSTAAAGPDATARPPTAPTYNHTRTAPVSQSLLVYHRGPKYYAGRKTQDRWFCD